MAKPTTPKRTRDLKVGDRVRTLALSKELVQNVVKGGRTRTVESIKYPAMDWETKRIITFTDGRKAVSRLTDWWQEEDE